MGMDAKEIARTRRWFGYDLKEMGTRIGAHFTTVSMMETGKRTPTEAQLRKLEALRRRMQLEMTRMVAEIS
jgi:DNA-binding XRE family transcriptional regulator